MVNYYYDKLIIFKIIQHICILQFLISEFDSPSTKKQLTYVTDYFMGEHGCVPHQHEYTPELARFRESGSSEHGRHQAGSMFFLRVFFPFQSVRVRLSPSPANQNPLLTAFAIPLTLNRSGRRHFRRDQQHHHASR